MRNKINNKSLAEIRETAAGLMQDYPAKENEIKNNLKAAEAARAAAEQTMETTIDETEYQRAEAAEKEAKSKAAFYTRQLDHLRHTPRMDEAEYFQYVDEIRRGAETARDTFRAAADDLMERLQAARDEYNKKIADANETARQLDAAANVLQSKYTHRIQERRNMEPVRKRDPHEWKKHTLSIDAASFFYQADNPDNPAARHISVYTTAWKATNEGSAYPVKRF